MMELNKYKFIQSDSLIGSYCSTTSVGYSQQSSLTYDACFKQLRFSLTPLSSVISNIFGLDLTTLPEGQCAEYY